MQKRLDTYLLENNLAPTRSQAQLLIKEGQVKVNGKPQKKSGFLIDEESKIELKEGIRYVGRGAQKMEAAIKAFKINPQDKIVVDCGASTGGFTDYLLKNGAKKSYCIDVGHDQLAPSLLEDERVINIEGHNLRNPIELPEKADLAVADLSFISLRLVLPTIIDLLSKKGEMVLLFKPQFEVGKTNVNKNGIVTKDKIREKSIDDFKDHCRTLGLKILDQIDSPIHGKEGNKEYLLHLKTEN